MESHFSSRAMTLGGFPGSWGWPYTYAHMGSSIWTWWDVLNKYQVGEDTVGPRQIRSRWLRGRYTPNTLYIWLKFSKNESIFLKFYPPPFFGYKVPVRRSWICPRHKYSSASPKARALKVVSSGGEWRLPHLTPKENFQVFYFLAFKRSLCSNC